MGCGQKFSIKSLIGQVKAGEADVLGQERPVDLGSMLWVLSQNGCILLPSPLVFQDAVYHPSFPSASTIFNREILVSKDDAKGWCFVVQPVNFSFNYLIFIAGGGGCGRKGAVGGIIGINKYHTAFLFPNLILPQPMEYRTVQLVVGFLNTSNKLLPYTSLSQPWQL